MVNLEKTDFHPNPHHPFPPFPFQRTKESKQVKTLANKVMLKDQDSKTHAFKSPDA